MSTSHDLAGGTCVYARAMWSPARAGGDGWIQAGADGGLVVQTHSSSPNPWITLSNPWITCDSMADQSKSDTTTGLGLFSPVYPWPHMCTHR